MEVIRLPDSESVKALVVDDIELSRNLLVDMLIEINAEVDSADNGQEAVNVVTSADAEHIPDIIFMDIRMPVMNGFDAVKQIKKLYGNNIVCVAVTASTMDNPDERYYQAGFDDYISKPYRFEAVFECMKKHLKINFEHESVTHPEQTDMFDVDIKQCHVDNELCDELIEASRTYALTNLKAFLTKMASYGSEEEKAAQKLTRMMEKYDMQGMIALIEEIKNNNESNESNSNN